MLQRLKAYLQLCRLPNVFTAMADVLAGFFITQPHSSAPIGALALLVGASCALYTAGMVLNDVFDFEEDLRERPFRPLPSGRIERGFALQLGLALLALGTGCGWLAGFAAARSGTGLEGAEPWRPGIVATGLACLVLLYDKFLKRTVLGPFAMGGCRFANVLLGMSAAGGAWDAAHYLIAGGIGVYIVGVTWFARSEARESPRGLLITGMLFMAAGFGLVALYPQFIEQSSIRLDQQLSPALWRLWLLVLLGFLMTRLGRALAAPSPQRVQAAVKYAILSLIFLDAAACVLARPIPALAIVLLILPAMLLGRWVYST